MSGQWNKTDFNSTLSLLMRDYATFPFFNLYVGKDPEETALGSTKRYIQAGICSDYLCVLIEVFVPSLNPSLLFVKRSISQIC